MNKLKKDSLNKMAVDELAGYLGLQRVSERLQCDEMIAQCSVALLSSWSCYSYDGYNTHMAATLAHWQYPDCVERTLSLLYTMISMEICDRKYLIIDCNKTSNSQNRALLSEIHFSFICDYVLFVTVAAVIVWYMMLCCVHRIKTSILLVREGEW